VISYEFYPERIVVGQVQLVSMQALGVRFEFDDEGELIMWCSESDGHARMVDMLREAADELEAANAQS
jgi:hypothetical protein